MLPDVQGCAEPSGSWAWQLTGHCTGCHRGPVTSFPRDDPAETESAIIEYYDAILSDYLGATGGGTLPVAVDWFAGPIERAFRQPGPDDERGVEILLWDAWQALIETAITPEEATQAKLVDLVLALQRRGVLTREPGGDECRVWGIRVWDELPLFGPQMREALNGDFDHTYRNLNAFAAQVTAAGRAVTGAVDFTLWAIWAFRDALESTPEQLREMGTGGEPEDRLPVVMAWLTYCGPLLAALAAKHPEDEGEMFCIPRWTRWRTRLNAIADGAEPAAGIAREALALMPSLP